MTDRETTDSAPKLPRVAFALALLTGGGLLFEIALTRVLSVLYFSTFSYLVLSIAVLGLAAGAALAALWPQLRQPRHWPLWAVLAGAGALLLTLIPLAGAAAGLRSFLFPLTALPYLFLGLAVAGIFAMRSESSPRLYLADLAGAGLGALLAVPLLDWLGGPGGMLAAACAAALAAVVLAPGKALSTAALAACVAALALHSAGLGPRLDLREMASPKPVRQSLRAGGEVASTRWDSFARSDLIRFEEDDRYLIYLDGAAGSLVPDADRQETWLTDVGALAFAVDPPRSAFLIGPGGGLDLALARRFSVPRVVAAEINRGAVELTRALEHHAGDLYGSPTELHIDDGRSALRRLDEQFELILLSQVVSQAAEARGLALVENGLYTVEAFDAYLDHLAPGGRVALKLYDELTLTRAIVTALRTLTERGVPLAVAPRHLFAALDTRASPPVPLLMVSAEPLSDERAVDWARAGEARDLGLLFVPGLLAPPALAALLDGSAGIASIARGASDLDLSATRDDRPFFYQFERGLPRPLRPLVVGVLSLLALALLAGGWWTRRRPAELRAAPVLFAALGSGFMLVEITVLQRTQLLIGHPALALAAILAALLLGAATGSGLASRAAGGREYPWVARAAGATALLVLAWLFAWPAAADAMGSLSPVSASLGSALSILPLAVMIGAPFPLALRSIGRHGPREVALAWAMNGVATVAGAVAATALAIVFGFSAALATAAIIYAVTAMTAWLLTRQRASPSGYGSTSTLPASSDF
ncbi:MAG: hypothetical protein WD314_06655 [Trueperaceae bacterium]